MDYPLHQRAQCPCNGWRIASLGLSDSTVSQLLRDVKAHDQNRQLAVRSKVLTPFKQTLPLATPPSTMTITFIAEITHIGLGFGIMTSVMSPHQRDGGDLVRMWLGEGVQYRAEGEGSLKAERGTCSSFFARLVIDFGSLSTILFVR